MESSTSDTQAGRRDWAPPPAGRRWTEADGRAAIMALNAGKETIAAFCRRHGLNNQRLRWWAERCGLALSPRKRSASGAGLAFLPVRVVDRPQPAEHQDAAGGLDVTIGKATVRVRRGFDRALLRDVVQALTSAVDL